MSGGTKLFVYGVNRSCPKDILEDHFAKIGAVSDVYITEKGYAFVTMADEGDAKAAMDELNGISVDGQEIKVEIAHGRGSTKPPGRGGYGERRGGGGGGYGDRRGGGFGFGGGERRGGPGGPRYGGGNRGGDREGGYRGDRGYGGGERGYGGGERGGYRGGRGGGDRGGRGRQNYGDGY